MLQRSRNNSTSHLIVATGACLCEEDAEWHLMVILCCMTSQAMYVPDVAIPCAWVAMMLRPVP